jgi:hypothetical protein
MALMSGRLYLGVCLGTQPHAGLVPLDKLRGFGVKFFRFLEAALFMRSDLW